MQRITVRTAIVPVVVLFAFFIAAATFERPVSAGAFVPFKASFTTEFSSSVAFPLAHITVNGEGEATHMGRTDASTANQVVNLITGAGTATYTLTGANGDTLTVAMVMQTGFPSPTEVTFSGTYRVTGGTGRFANATGSGSIDGSATFTGPTGGVGEFALDGDISSVGSRK